MNWKKLGLIYKFESICDNLISHASNPLAVHLEGDVFRVYFSGRDNKNRSSVGFVDIDIVKREVINTCREECLKYGDENDFYHAGVSVGCAIDLGKGSEIFFMGWQTNGLDHWRGDIGAVKFDVTKDRFEKPVLFLGVDEEDKVSLSYPWIIKENGIYKMWYGSTESWTSENGEMIHVIKYATSEDGKNWDRHGVAVPYKLNEAQAFSRPTVLRLNDKYYMWYSYRSGTGEKYRIGLAVSEDGVTWERSRDSGITVSDSGWDSEMVCYPCVITHKGETYMLYNGNDFGRDGFGLAQLEG